MKTYRPGVGGGSGIVAQRAMAITNNGLIQGGNSAFSAGGIGVNLGGSDSRCPSVTDQQRHDYRWHWASGGGTGVRLATGATYLENNGTIIGGTGSNGITSTIANTHIVPAELFEAGWRY